MKKFLRLTLIWASFAAAFAVFAPLALAGTQTYYVSPTGTGEACNQAVPCNLEYAVKEAVNEDSVVVGPGTYTLTESLGIFRAIDIGGTNPAAKPVIKATSLNNVFTGQVNSPKIHDLRIEGTGGFVLNRGVAERVFVSFVGTSSSGCSVGLGATMLDTVCWAHNAASSSAAIQSSAPGAEGTVTLRNVTAIAATEAAAISAKASSGGVLKLNAFNVIARAAHHKDISTDFSGFSAVTVTLANSSYSTLEELPPFTTVTPPGTNSNQMALPSFIDAANGDFREALGSPTIDAGVTDAANGLLGIEGEMRAIGSCGATATDIGAFEFVPTVACPVPSPPISNQFTLGKLKLNKQKGTGTLAVTLPRAGELTLSGKGVKKVTRSAKGAATLKLPVKPVGKWKKRLLETGKLKVSLKLKFVPTGGTAAQKSKKATLKENLR